MNKIEFNYQNYYFKWLAGSLVIASAYLLGYLLSHNISSALLAILIYVALGFCFMNIYYRISEFWFNKTGQYYIDKDTVVILLNNKSYVLNEIREIYLSKKIVYGTSFCQLDIMLSNDKYYEIFSLPLDKKDDVKNCSLYLLFLTIIQTNPQLNMVLSTPKEIHYQS